MVCTYCTYCTICMLCCSVCNIVLILKDSWLFMRVFFTVVYQSFECLSVVEVFGVMVSQSWDNKITHFCTFLHGAWCVLCIIGSFLFSQSFRTKGGKKTTICHWLLNRRICLMLCCISPSTLLRLRWLRNCENSHCLHISAMFCHVIKANDRKVFFD
jgi:hypothetical protein